MKYTVWKTVATSLLFACGIGANAQVGKEYVIPMSESVRLSGRGAITKGVPLKNMSLIKKMPEIKCDTFTVYQSPKNFAAKLSLSNMIFTFTGVDRKLKRKYVVTDTNQNLDFTDDILIAFPMFDEELPREDKLEKSVGVQVPVDSVKREFLRMGIDAYGCVGGIDSEDELDLNFCYGAYWVGRYILDGTPIDVEGEVGDDFARRRMEDKSYFNFIYTNQDGEIVHKSARKGDTIQIADRLYQLAKVEQPDITLRSVGTLADSSVVGSVAPRMVVRRIADGGEVSLNERLKGKYVFIDFWGSWCVPCLSSLPKLKELYERIKGREDVTLVGLASEKQSTVEKLKRTIAQEGVSWDNYWMDQKETPSPFSVPRKMGVNAYPTYIILDNTGRIVYRNHSSFKTEEAIDFFLKLISEK